MKKGREKKQRRDEEGIILVRSILNIKFMDRKKMGKVQPFRDCSGKETDHQEIPIQASPMN